MRYAYVDCDRTLIFSRTEYPELVYTGLPEVKIGGRQFYLNKYLLEELKDFHAMGHIIVVWSAGGEAWARKVVEAAEMSSYVTYVLSKPDFLFDDKKSTEWMPDAQDVNPRTKGVNFPGSWK